MEMNFEIRYEGVVGAIKVSTPLMVDLACVCADWVVGAELGDAAMIKELHKHTCERIDYLLDAPVIFFDGTGAEKFLKKCKFYLYYHWVTVKNNLFFGKDFEEYKNILKMSYENVLMWDDYVSPDNCHCKIYFSIIFK